MTKEKVRYALICKKAYRLSQALIVEEDGEQKVVESAAKDIAEEESNLNNFDEKLLLNVLISDELEFTGPLGPIMRETSTQGIRVYSSGLIEVDEGRDDWKESPFKFQDKEHVAKVVKNLIVNNAGEVDSDKIRQQCKNDFSIEYKRDSDPVLLMKRRTKS